MNQISSPVSTGGAGTFFEQHVGAYWLAQLLVGGIPPILIDCSVIEVHFQTEHLGWHTDDFLIIAQSRPGKMRRLAGQVKLTFTVSSADEECKKTIQDFWKDFKNPDRFSPLTDRLALVTQRATNTLLHHFGSLLDCSRAANNETEFAHRLATPGLLSSKAIHYCDEIRAIIGEVEGRVVSLGEIWPFLRVLHVLTLDLNTATRQTEAAIKSLLAYTTADADPLDTATHSWNVLLAEVGDSMPSARTFQRQDLSASLRERHDSIATEHRMLTALRDHTAIILRGIRSTVGSSLHLPRTGLVQQVIEKIKGSQIVMLSGAAGAGKSTIAKEVISLISQDYFAFCFRAEEFACSHFDATLQNSQIPGHATTLGTVLASQDQKVLLIESVERLLEKATRDAFTDLLTLAADDPTLHIIMTCRDYSTDLVRSCFLQSAPIGHAVLEIPPLNDAEIGEVQTVYPALSAPLENSALRQILRNPYVLDKALRIDWAAQRPLPQSEREFRALFWREIVRADHHMSNGMPVRRELAVSTIALRRARALSLYVDVKDLDQGVITALRADSLLVISERDEKLVSPAHDVLEDWAILRWIEEQHASVGESIRELCDAIGPQPALRRGYRKWVSELIEYDSASADRLFLRAITDKDVPYSFRDDTLVAFLRAPSAPAFLERHSAKLLSNGNGLLRRVIHLLRVACVKTPSWFEGLGPLFNVPDGPAWNSVLQLVHTNLNKFGEDDSLLLLGLIEDWARGVSVWTPYPEGAKFAAGIAHFLLPGFNNYRSGEERKRTLQVIAKIPSGDRELFGHLFQGNQEEDDSEDERPSRLSDELQDIIFAGIDGIPVARDAPDVLVSVLRKKVLCSDSDLQDEFDYPSSLELDIQFGLNPRLGHDYFPASAYHTPLLPLLRHHPRIGLDFLISVFNHSADWYAHPRIQDQIEPPFEMELKFADGTIQKQWANSRLWNWYRGSSVGPDILQSYLMALERWLLELAEARPGMLDSVLLDILRKSESAALTAVVASAATAFPLQAGETLVTLLRSPMCILLDRQRWVAESQTPSKISGMMPDLRPENRIHYEERKEADSLPHRNSDLETAVVNLQLGPLRGRVHEVFDEHNKTLPPAAEQTDEDRMWRLSMHRMDLRQYSVSESMNGSVVSQQDGGTSSVPEKAYIRLELNAPEPDVQQMVEENAPSLELFQSRTNLLMWGLNVFKRENDKLSDPGQWRDRLKEAQSAVANSDPSLSGIGLEGGSGIVAAVCIRDFWEEMSADDRQWCVEIICSEVMRNADNWNHIARVQRFDMSADRACAWVLPALIGKSFSKTTLQRIQKAFVAALTHPIDEVRWYNTWGIAEQLWSLNRDLTLRCVNAIAAEARIISELQGVEDAKPYVKRRPHEEILAQAASMIRQNFWRTGSLIEDDAYAVLDIKEWYGAEANNRLLAILSKAPNEPAATAAFARAAKVLVSYWNPVGNDDEPQHQRNHEAELALSKLLQDFVMNVPAKTAEAVLEPILDAVDDAGRDIYFFILGLIDIEDRQPNTDHFWSIWELFAAKVKRAGWIDDLDDKYATGNELIAAMFVGTQWKENVRHWRSLEGHAHRIDSLFESLPPSATALDDYVRFLYHVGERSLPQSFVRIAKRLKAGDTRQLLSKGNTVFMLAVLLQRHVYRKPLELKRDQELREAVLFLLDQLVESGSSASFRMRDDFVTPASAA